MFSLRSAKGRRALLAVAMLAVTMIACDTDSPTAPTTDPVADEQEEQDGQDGGSDGDDGSGAEQGEAEGESDDSTDEAEATAEEVIAAAEETYESCHEANSAGGASDGVLFFALLPPDVEILTGVAVEIDVEKGDGSVVTVPGTLQDDGMVFLIPLSSFGEVITIVDVRIGGQSFDPGVVGTQYTVDPESSCENHPEVE